MASQRIDFILSAQADVEQVLAQSSKAVNKFKKTMKGEIEQTKQAASATAKFKHSMKGLAASIGRATAPLDKMLGSLGGLQGALKLGLIAAAGKKLVEFAGSGAVLEAQLSRLGPTADIALKKIEAMQGASGRVFSLEALAKAEIMQKELGVHLNFTGLELEKLDARFTAMGMDGAQSLEQVITALARSRKSFLQVLGLVRDLEGAYKRYGEAQGVARRDLTELQKREALIMEVKANIQAIDLEAGRSVAAFEQMNAAFSDSMTYLKLSLAPLGKMLKPIAYVVRDLAKVLAAVLKPALVAINYALTPVYEMVEGLAWLFDRLSDAVSRFFSMFSDAPDYMEQATRAVKQYSDQLSKQLDLTRKVEKAEKAKSTGMAHAAVVALEATRSLIQYNRVLKLAEIDATIGKPLRVLEQQARAYSLGTTGDIARQKEIAALRLANRTAREGIEKETREATGKANESIEYAIILLKEQQEIAGDKTALDMEKKKLDTIKKRITLLQKLEGSTRGLTNVQTKELKRLKALRQDLETVNGLRAAQNDYAKTLEKIETQFVGKTGEDAVAQKKELLKLAEETFNVSVDNVSLEREAAGLVKIRTGRAPSAAKTPGPPPDRTAFYTLELAILLAKQGHLDTDRLSLQAKLKYLHLTEQIKKESEGSQEAAIRLHNARTDSATSAFNKEKQRRMDEVQFEMAMLTVHDDAIAQFKRREVVAEEMFAATSKSAEGIEMRNTAELEYAHALAELQRTKSQYLEEEYRQKIKILEKTKKLTEEEAKRVDFAKHWGDMSATFSATGSAMSGVNKEMGALTNAMGQGAQITANHVKENQAWQTTTQQGMVVGQQAAMSMVEDTEKQAAIGALFEAAKGFVALATPGMGWAAAFHFAAAAAFGAIAGGAFGGEKAKKKPARQRDRGGGEGGGQIIVNMAAGVILGRPQDIGRAIGQATGAISKTGMGTSAV